MSRALLILSTPDVRARARGWIDKHHPERGWNPKRQSGRFRRMTECGQCWQTYPANNMARNAPVARCREAVVEMEAEISGEIVAR